MSRLRSLSNVSRRAMTRCGFCFRASCTACFRVSCNDPGGCGDGCCADGCCADEPAGSDPRSNNRSNMNIRWRLEAIEKPPNRQQKVRLKSWHSNPILCESRRARKLRGILRFHGRECQSRRSLQRGQNLCIGEPCYTRTL